MRSAALLMLLSAATGLYAQSTPTTWDTSGNSLLKGSFYFRQVAYSIGDDTGDLGDADAIYGQITFDGNGNYTISAAGANGGAVLVDAYNGSISNMPATTGTYGISSSGYGYITSPAASGDLVFGLVSSNGVFVGSSTDNVNGYNDMMIMARIASPAPTASSFNGSWTMSSFDPNINGNFEVSYMLNTVATMNPDGNGHLNVASIKGYENGSSSPITQSVSGLSYIFSSGAAVATFPNNGSLLYGQKYFYFSPDGNFFFGGSPQNFDMIVGVKTNTSNPTVSGLYFQVGLDETLNSSGGDMDTYFGSVDAVKGSSGLTLIGHQRVNDFGGTLNLAYGASLYDYTYTNPITFTGNESTTSTTGFIAGDNGQVIITTGLGGYLGLSVSLQAPTPSAGSGVWIDPQGVVNSASFAPFTARIAPGELITLFGSNLASTTAAIQGGQAAPTTLGNVQVTIGGYPAPIFSVSAGQVSVIVPYEVAVGSTVGIQVNNAGQMSNTVTQYVSNTAPGVFTQCACGIQYGWIAHLGIGNSVAAVGSPVSDSNPAVEGETLAVGLTGLGVVTPSISDGAVPPTSGTNTTNNTFQVDLSGVSATVGFSGLLPGLAAEYQMNVTMPTSGVTVGPNYFDIAGMDSSGNLDSYMSYPLIPVQATPPSSTTASAELAKVTVAPPKFHRAKPAANHARLPVKRVFTQPKTGAADNQ